MTKHPHTPVPRPRGVLRGILTILTAVVLAGCGDRTGDLATAEWDRKNDREYVTTWRVQDVPVLEVHLSYHGKEPQLPFTGPKPGTDWKTRDTDFYSCVLRNLTDQPIHLRAVSLGLDKGTPANDQPQGSAYLSERWGSDVIPPDGTLTRRNTWVWGKGSENTLTKTYRAEIVPPSETQATGSPLDSLLEQQEHTPISFAFQVPLRYRR